MNSSPVLRALDDTGQSWDDPSEDLLLMLIEAVQAGDSQYLIVESTVDPAGQTYIQTMPGADGSYLIERRDGGADRHFSTEVLGPAEAHRVLTDWAFGARPGAPDLSWRHVTV